MTPPADRLRGRGGSGIFLIGAIIATLGVSYGLSRVLGLSTKLSILVACGNSICGQFGNRGGSSDHRCQWRRHRVVHLVHRDPRLDAWVCPCSFRCTSATQQRVSGRLLSMPCRRCGRHRTGRIGQHADRYARQAGAGVDAGPAGCRTIAVRAAPARRELRAARSSPSARSSWCGSLSWPALVRGRSRCRGHAGQQDRGHPHRGAVLAALGLGVDVRVLSNVGGRATVAVTLSLMLLLAMSIGLVSFFR